MRYIQETAANSFVKVIDPSQVALSRKIPFTMKQLRLGSPEKTALLTKNDSEKALKKGSNKITNP